MSDEEKETFNEERKPIRVELDKLSKATAEKLSNFRVKIYSYVLENMLRAIKEKKVKSFSIHLNNTNVLHITP